MAEYDLVGALLRRFQRGCNEEVGQSLRAEPQTQVMCTHHGFLSVQAPRDVLNELRSRRRVSFGLGEAEYERAKNQLTMESRISETGSSACYQEGEFLT